MEMRKDNQAHLTHAIRIYENIECNLSQYLTFSHRLLHNRRSDHYIISYQATILIHVHFHSEVKSTESDRHTNDALPASI